MEILKAQLETARQAAGEAIDVFYHPRRNASNADVLQRSHRLKGEMVSLIQRAEAWVGQSSPTTGLIAARHVRHRTACPRA